MWVNLTQEAAAAASELEALPDRAAAIVGATILEAKLGDRLKKETPSFIIKGSNSLHDRMFASHGPLGAFSARINMGFMLKIYNEAAWRDLDVIRSIRNDFAHATGIGSFSTVSVRDRCKNLKVCDSTTAFVEYSSENNVLVSVSEPIGSPVDLELMLHVPDLDARRADPRQRYLLCVKYYSAYLDYPLGFQTYHH